jgi:hypothetical protein
MDFKILAETSHIIGCVGCGSKAFWTVVGSWRYTSENPTEVAVLISTGDLLMWKKHVRPGLLRVLGDINETSIQAPHSEVIQGFMNQILIKVIVIEPPRSFGLAEVFCSLTSEDKKDLIMELKTPRNNAFSLWPKNGFIYTKDGELFGNHGIGDMQPIGPLEFPSTRQFLHLVRPTITGTRLFDSWKEIKDFNWS